MKPTPYGPFRFSPIDRRPRLQWPNAARLALWVITNIEFFALDRPMPGDSNERPKGSEATPQVRHWSQRDYGNRVGITRIMQVLQAPSPSTPMCATFIPKLCRNA
jgi:allantoinase